MLGMERVPTREFCWIRCQCGCLSSVLWCAVCPFKLIRGSQSSSTRNPWLFGTLWFPGAHIFCINCHRWLFVSGSETRESQRSWHVLFEGHMGSSTIALEETSHTLPHQGSRECSHTMAGKGLDDLKAILTSGCSSCSSLPIWHLTTNSDSLKTAEAASHQKLLALPDSLAYGILINLHPSLCQHNRHHSMSSLPNFVLSALEDLVSISFPDVWEHFTRFDLVFQPWRATFHKGDTHENLSRFWSPPTWLWSPFGSKTTYSCKPAYWQCYCSSS